MCWNTIWKYLPINYNTTIGSLEKTTQKVTFQNNLCGKSIKLKFSNKYASNSLTLNQVILAKQLENGTIAQYTDITSNGLLKIVIPSGEEFYSDEIPFSLSCNENIVVFTYFEGPVTIQSGISVWSTQSCHTLYRTNCDSILLDNCTNGWQESCDIFPYAQADVNKPNIVVGISEICVQTQNDVKTIALFGDSITHMSYYSDALLTLLKKNFPGKVCLQNYGIGGNRLLNNASFFPNIDGEGMCFGPAGVNRFKDIFISSNPDCVVALEGINDIMHPYFLNHPEEIISADDLESGIKRIVSISHQHQTPIYIGTIMPFQEKKLQSWYQVAENTRVSLNNRIRNSTYSDGIIDFDILVQDSADPQWMKDGLHIGDGLHPNTTGGQIMAQLVFDTIKNIL